MKDAFWLFFFIGVIIPLISTAIGILMGFTFVCSIIALPCIFLSLPCIIATTAIYHKQILEELKSGNLMQRAFDFLKASSDTFSGIYLSHFRGSENIYVQILSKFDDWVHLKAFEALYDRVIYTQYFSVMPQSYATDEDARLSAMPLELVNAGYASTADSSAQTSGLTAPKGYESIETNTPIERRESFRLRLYAKVIMEYGNLAGLVTSLGSQRKIKMLETGCGKGSGVKYLSKYFPL
mmetsp:Transcript_2620/g.4382  ORF Transcript_2620/g.4382 Transcript_2620/m.4382 type:complete len:238 (+) Transcript_2620:125-838(+)